MPDSPPDRPRGPLARYGFAIVATAVAAGGSFALNTVAGTQFPFLTALLAVLASGWYGGFGPALLAAAAGGAVAGARHPSPAAADDRLALLTFAAVAGGTALFARAAHRAFARALAPAVAVAGHRDRLQEEVADPRAAHEAVARAAGSVREILESITDAFYALDRQWRFTYLNREAERLLGRPRDELLGRNAWAEFPAVVGRRFQKEYDRAVEGNVAVHFEEFYPPLGRWFEVNAYPSPGGLAVYFRDVTGRKAAEAAARRTEDRYRSLVEATAQIVWTTDAAGRVAEDSPTWRAFTGQAYADWVGYGWLDAVHPDDRARVEADWRAAVAAGAPYRAEYRLRAAAGGYRHAVARGVPVREPDGAVREWVGMNTDVHDKVLAERALLDREALLRSVGDNLPGAIYQATRDPGGPTRFVYVSAGIERLVGVRPADAVADPAALFGLIHADDLPRVLAAEDAAAAALAPFDCEFRNRTAGGELKWVHVRSAPRRLPDGGLVYDGLITDVTARRAAEADARDREARFRHLADAVPQIVFVVDPDGRVEFVNRRWEEYTGRADADDLSPVIHPDDLLTMAGGWEAARESGLAYEAELRLRRADGAYRWFLTRSVPARDDGGRVVRWFGTSTEIDDRKRLEAELREADRRKDEFLAMLAHELRNPLAPIRTAVEVLRLADHDPARRADARGLIARQVDHLVRLVDDLLDVSRLLRGKVELRREPVELTDVLRRAVETSRPLIDGGGHALELDLPAAPVWLDGDTVRLTQVFGNLLNNAAKYCDRGGRITLAAAPDPGGGAVVVRVRDTGIGIDPALLPRVFDLFVQADPSAARSQGGLGIGLTLVKRLVELHGGGVTAASDGPGAGSEFTVRLPVMRDAEYGVRSEGRPPGPDSAFQGPSTATRKRVLIVDDNADAADSLAFLLEAAGHAVRTAHTGPAALAAVRAEAPEVILLDLGLPGMDGFEVCRRVRAELPARPVMVVALTGYGQEADRRKTAAAGFDLHLVKPVDPRAVADLLAK